MTDSLPPHTDKVRALLVKLDDDRSALLRLHHEGYAKPGSAIFPLDLLALGAAKRAVSANSAFKQMIEAWNLTSARTMLRTHIDTGLRFSAAWLVDKPHDFATDVMKGERIDKMKDRDGKRLTDAYLVETRSDEYPWLPAVYKELSGYVHFSGSHVGASMERLEGDDGAVMFLISETDLKFPEFSWIEAIECFREATDMLARFLNGYALTKQLTPEQLEEGRKLYMTSQAK